MDAASEDRLDDSVLVERCRNGHFASFNVLVERHKTGVFNVALRMLGHYEDASDVMQDAFIKAFENLRTFEGRSSFRTWLYSILIRQCLTFRRKRLVATNRTVSFDETVQNPGQRSRLSKPDSNPVTTTIRKEQMDRLSQEVTALSTQYRATFVLRDLEGLTYAEIARALGISTGTVKSRIHRARSILAERLKDVM